MPNDDKSIDALGIKPFYTQIKSESGLVLTSVQDLISAVAARRAFKENLNSAEWNIEGKVAERCSWNSVARRTLEIWLSLIG